MKNLMLPIAIPILVFFVLWLIGPRFIISKAPTHILELPDDIDGYLADSEATISGLKEGIQKEITWAHEDKRQTEYSIIYLHGFSSSRKELSPVMENIAGELGANLFFTRFKGHGSQTGELMATANRNDWMEDALEARVIGHRIGKKLIIAGTSHGGLLAAWVATQKLDIKPVALILISPNFAPKDKRTQLLTMPWGKQVLPFFFGSHRVWEPQNSGHDYYWNTQYPSQALFPMMAQVNYITPRTPHEVDIPTLVFYSTQDTTVESQTIETAFQQFPTEQKTLIPIENSSDRNNHILAGDILSPQTNFDLVAEILKFIQKNTHGTPD